MINFDDITKENIKENNLNWPQIPNHPYRMLIIGSCGSEKTNWSFNITNQQSDIDNIYLYAKEYEAKYQISKYEVKYKFLINKPESTDLKHLNDSILKWCEWYLQKYWRIQFKYET